MSRQFVLGDDAATHTLPGRVTRFRDVDTWDENDKVKEHHCVISDWIAQSDLTFPPK